jgi:hypothetical protein
MNTCAEIRESIGPWLDGEVSAERAEAVRSHLEACAACAEEQRQLAKLDLAMRAVLESESARLGATPFWEGVRQRIETKSSPWRERFAEWVILSFRAPSFAWAVPAVILLLIGALHFDLLTYTWSIGAPRNNFATVESIDAYGRNVALLREHESKTTVIWLYQSPDSEDEAAGEVIDKGPAF